MPKPVLTSYLPARSDFESGADTPRKFLERCLERLHNWEEHLQAFVHLNIQGAQRSADAASTRWRENRILSPIDGIPIGVKDIMETCDLPTEQGSPLFVGWQSTRDAALVSGLREAGVVVLGKTVTTEFAATEPGPTRNPWDLSRTPGGSSSGSAAAVGAGILPAALGTQVIGSIIRPASYCGCFGYKPSIGSLNRGGSFDHLSQSSAGVLAATLDELWMVAREGSARIGGDPGHPGLSGPRTPPESRKPQTIVILETSGLASASAQAAEALIEFAQRLKNNKIRVLRRIDAAAIEDAEVAIANAGSLSRSINAWESRWPLNTYAIDMNREGLSPAMRDRLKQAESMTQEQYQELLLQRERCRSTYAALSAMCDVCITLSAPDIAPVGLESTGDPTFAIPGSLLGVPAISIPAFQIGGLPLGLQVLGFSNRDADLFACASYVQAV